MRPGPTRPGPSYLLRGFGMWRHRPRLMLLGMVPAALVFAALASLFVVLLLHVDVVAAWMTPFADDWAAGLRDLVRLLLAVALLGAVLVGSVLSFTGLTLLVGDPFYERIWRATEQMLGGEVPDGGLSLAGTLRDSVVLVLLGLATGLGVAVLGFLPVIGAVVGVVAGFLVAGRVLAGELLSRPLEARGLDRRARAALLRPHRGRVLGFGAATQAFFLVPLGAIVVMPAAVVGSTMMARDVLEAQAPPAVPPVG